MSQILHVVVVGFHHKKGCQIEYAHPPLKGDGEFGLPDEWSCLPSLAIPDGSHNSTNDTVYFSLPSIESSGEIVFGISCYRQISTEDLISKEDDISRNTVQKSVCIISRTPLYGVLKAKLQLITQAYFNERDFSRVEVLASMYTNLCDMFDGDLLDGQAATMDIPVREFFQTFRHRAVLLFKLLLLEKRVFFFITPAQLLGDTMLSLISLFPKVLEEGLQYGSYGDLVKPVSQPLFEVQVEDVTEKPEKTSEEILKNDPLKEKDSYGFPLSIFTQGNAFLPYVSLPLLDTIRPLKSFTAGATNALFTMKKENFDAVITINEIGAGNVDFIETELKKDLFLTSADLRFGDWILKNIENRCDQSIFDGGDEWIRLQMRHYLLSLIATSRSSLANTIGDFGTAFVNQWKTTNNFRVLTARCHDDLVSVPPGHPFAGQIGLNDVLLRVEHNVAGSKNARKALSAISSTGKNIGETGLKVKQSLSNWLKGNESNEGAERSSYGWFKSASSSAIADDSSQKSGGSPNDQEGISSKVKSLASWWKKDNTAAAEAKEVKSDESS